MSPEYAQEWKVIPSSSPLVPCIIMRTLILPLLLTKNATRKVDFLRKLCSSTGFWLLQLVCSSAVILKQWVTCFRIQWIVLKLTKKPTVTFSSCPYPLECLLCYYFTPFKNILTHIFCFALSWLSRKDNWNLFLLGCIIIVSSEDYLALFLYCSYFLLCFWFLKLLPFGLFHFMQSCILLAHLPCLICVGPAVSFLRRELKHSFFPKSSVVSVPSLFAWSENVGNDVLCSVNVFNT